MLSAAGRRLFTAPVMTGVSRGWMGAECGGGPRRQRAMDEDMRQERWPVV